MTGAEPDIEWPAGRTGRFLIVEYPKRRHCTLMSTDLSLSALEIAEIYLLQFNIEHGFKQAKDVIGTSGYHLLM